MKKSIVHLLMSCMLCLAVSACGSGSGSSSIINPGSGTSQGTPGAVFGDVRWSTDIPGDMSSVAIGSDGTLYAGAADQFLYAIRPDGTIRWKYETGDAINGSPAVGSDGTIYVGSKDRQVYAITAEGVLKWVFPTKSNFASGPAIGDDGTIYIGGVDQDLRVYVCPDNSTRTERIGYLYAINTDGTQKWRVILSGFINSSPAIGTDGTIYIGSAGDNDDLSFDRTVQCDSKSVIPGSDADQRLPVNGHLYAITSAGSIKWDFKTLGDVDSSPAIGGDGTIYVGSDAPLFEYGADKTSVQGLNPTTEGYIYAVNPDGTLKWLYDVLGNADASPVIGADGTIYMGSDKNDFFAFNPDGTLKWVYPTRGDVNSSAAIASDGTIYVGSDDKSLYAFNADGTEKLRFDAGGDVGSSPAIGADGTVYFLSSGKLFALVGTGGLAESPWPKFRHDPLNTGRAKGN